MNHTYLVIPVYNGAPYIQQTCKELQVWQQTHHFFSHIIFVDDGSTDDTKVTLEQEIKKINTPCEILSYTQNQGKGYALRHAIVARILDNDIVAFTDIDIPYGLDVIASMIKKIQIHADVDMVVGNRRSVQNMGTKQYTSYRAVAHTLFRLLMPRQVRSIPDTQCGLKVFRGRVARDIFSHIQTFRWVFDIELFLIARVRKYHIDFEPVSIRQKSLDARGNLSFVRHGYTVISDLLRIYFTTYT